MLHSPRQQITAPRGQSSTTAASNLIYATSKNNTSTTTITTESPTKTPNDALTRRRVIHHRDHHLLLHQPSNTPPFSKENYSKEVVESNSSSSASSQNFKDNNSASNTLSKNFQSLKLESMVEEYGAASNTLTSALQKNIMHGKQYVNNASGSLVDYNDSDSVSSSSGDERELTHTIFQEQVKFFCQMKDFLLSQQIKLRHQLEALNFKLIKKQRPHTRRRRMMGPLAASSSSTTSTLHIPNVSTLHKTDVVGVHDSEPPDVPQDNIPHFFSCSSTEKSDIFQSCPICGLELDTQENADALEEHVIEHFTAGTSH